MYYFFSFIGEYNLIKTINSSVNHKTTIYSYHKCQNYWKHLTKYLTIYKIERNFSLKCLPCSAIFDVLPDDFQKFSCGRLETFKTFKSRCKFKGNQFKSDSMMILIISCSNEARTVFTIRQHQEFHYLLDEVWSP